MPGSLNSLFTLIPGRRDIDRLYYAVVAPARSDVFFAGPDVPDAPESRCALVALHEFRAMDRLGRIADRGGVVPHEVVGNYLYDGRPTSLAVVGFVCAYFHACISELEGQADDDVASARIRFEVPRRGAES